MSKVDKEVAQYLKDASSPSTTVFEFILIAFGLGCIATLLAFGRIPPWDTSPAPAAASQPPASVKEAEPFPAVVLVPEGKQYIFHKPNHPGWAENISIWDSIQKVRELSKGDTILNVDTQISRDGNVKLVKITTKEKL